MKATKIILRRGDKLTLPRIYESSTVELEVQYELSDGEDEEAATAAAKQNLDKIYWKVLASVYQEFQARVNKTTPAFLAEKLGQQPGY